MNPAGIVEITVSPSLRHKVENYAAAHNLTVDEATAVLVHSVTDERGKGLETPETAENGIDLDLIDVCMPETGLQKLERN